MDPPLECLAKLSTALGSLTVVVGPNRARSARFKMLRDLGSVVNRTRVVFKEGTRVAVEFGRTRDFVDVMEQLWMETVCKKWEITFV